MRKLALILFTSVLIFSASQAEARASLQSASVTASEIIDAVNLARFQVGLYPYRLNEALMDIAQAHSEDQAAMGEMTHQGTNGSTSTERAAEKGYGGSQPIQVNEMIYSGQFVTSAAAIDFWITSDVHNAILLSTDYHEFGVGVATDGEVTYITVDVALIVGSTSPLALTRSTPYAAPIPEYGAGVTSSPGNPTIIPQSSPIPLDENNAENPSASGDGNPLPPGWTSNLQVLWSVICIQAIVLVLMAYYIWRFRTYPPSSRKTRESSNKTIDRMEFSKLSHPDQFDRLQELALSSISEYPLELSRITKLEYRLNASFFVEAVNTAEPEVGVQKYLLRVNAPGFQNRSTIDSEMMWLSSILRDTSLIVPQPLANLEGSMVTTIEHKNIPEPRHCSVVTWIEGRSPHQQTTDAIIEEVGVFLGKLHQHSAGYVPPAGFERKTWDLRGFSSEMLDTPVTKIRRSLKKEQIELIERVSAKINATVTALDRNENVFGLIHGNFHERNYLIYRGEVRGVDFDACGWGFFAYDLAVTLSHLVGRPHFSVYREALLRGYSQVRLIGEGMHDMLGTFIAARYLYNMLWLAGHAEDTIFTKEAPQLIQRYGEFLDRFLQRG